jgi:hypothetical protein
MPGSWAFASVQSGLPRRRLRTAVASQTRTGQLERAVGSFGFDSDQLQPVFVPQSLQV